jgi:metal-dependent amidase/aminoacylase/carboxypeptidase family protein
MGGEDFAYYAERVPGLMARLGVRNEARGLVHPLHHPRFDLDEDALPLGAAVLAGLRPALVAGPPATRPSRASSPPGRPAPHRSTL